MNAKRKALKQSGAIPFAKFEDGLRVMLVTPRDGGRWIIPKGNIAKGMSPGKSAAKEAFEEAGVEGSCSGRPIGFYEYRKGGRQLCRVEVFPMKISRTLDDWPEDSERRRRLFKLEKALELLQEDKLKTIVAKIPRHA